MNWKALAQKLDKLGVLDALSARTPKLVTTILALESGTACPICPRCDCTLDREYMKYCDRCGQRLSWDVFDSAAIIFAPRKKKYE